MRASDSAFGVKTGSPPALWPMRRSPILERLRTWRACRQCGRIEIRAVGCAVPFDLDRGGLDLGRVRAGRFGDAAGERGEFHRFQEGDEARAVLRMQHEIFERQ